MRGQVRLELLHVYRAAGLRQVVDRLLRRQPEREPEVAELEVEVDQGDPLASQRKRHREVGGRQRLARPTLRSEHADHRRDRNPACRCSALPARNGLLKGERNALGRLGKVQDVVGASLENPPDEAVLRALGEDDDRPVRPLLESALDEVERAVRMAAARDREQVDRGLLERAPTLLEPVDHAEDLDLAGGRKGRLNDRALDARVDGDECLDHRHRYCTGLSPSRVLVSNKGTLWTFAPDAGRRASQIFPLSEANASAADCLVVARSTTAPAGAPLDAVRRTSAFSISSLTTGRAPPAPDWLIPT